MLVYDHTYFYFCSSMTQILLNVLMNLSRAKGSKFLIYVNKEP